MHRDLKPDNILLKSSSSLDLCLVDFGLADIYDSSNQYLFTKCGTPGFVAPEILNSLPYGPKVDVFSAGIIMYGMLCGKYPFNSLDKG